MFNLTGLRLCGHLVDVPPGLSDLLTDAWVKKAERPKVGGNYNRQVVKKSERLVTILTKI